MNKNNNDLLQIANDIGDNWVESPYYEEAEKWLHIFWDENTPFKKLFTQLNLTHVLELACGHGRHGEKLKGQAKKLTMMDINESNVNFVFKDLKMRKILQL
jgi:ubiquinone/menaquinone biosynthesis C-methylase UbiE